MKNTIVTELVKFQVLETTTDEQLVAKADNVNEFHKKQDGYIDTELVKSVEENVWYFIYHYESLEKIQAVGAKLRSSKEFEEFIPLIHPESIAVSFHHQMRKW